MGESSQILTRFGGVLGKMLFCVCESLQILIGFGGVVGHKCRVNVCMGEGSQMLTIRFGGRTGCPHCLKYCICIHVSILFLNIYIYKS